MKIDHVKKWDPGYPEILCNYERMPMGLYVAGHFPHAGKKTVAIVGARACTAYGRRMAYSFGKVLGEQGVQVISGMAEGIDAWAHKGALEGGGESFAVLGCGVDVCYPYSNRLIYQKMCEGQGGVLSEYEPGSEPFGWHFPVRNRIISALADLVIVVEARKKSGSLITADYALEQGKTLYAVPGRNEDPLSEGCNHLIAQGAFVAESPENILEALGGIPREKKKTPEIPDGLSSQEMMVWLKLGTPDQTLETLSASTGLAPDILMKTVVEMQLKNIIIEETPGIYARKP